MKLFRPSRTVYWLASLIVITVAFFYFKSYTNNGSIVYVDNHPWLNQQEQFKIDSSTKPSGNIHLTLEPIDGSVPQGLYFFNLESKELQTFPIKENIPAITSEISTVDEDIIAFISWDANSLSQIFTIDTSNKLLKITDSSTLKLSPEWSFSGDDIAYSALELSKAGDFESLMPEDWDVYVTDLKGNETFISDGVYPKWSPNNEKILLMKNDGLYLYSSRGNLNKGKLVWKVVGGEALISSMRLDVSPDGKMLAWSNIESGEIVLININSWETADMSIYKRIPSESFWPVFSPDSKSLVVQEIDYNAVDSNPRLVIYNLNTFTRETVLDLSDFNQGKMFVSDWSK